LYEEEYDFIGDYVQKAEVASTESKNPLEYFKNKNELIGWFLLYSKSYLHDTQNLDEKLLQQDYSIVGEYKEFLKNIKNTNSPYGKVIQFSDMPDRQLRLHGEKIIEQQLNKKIKSLLGNTENISVIREAGKSESVQGLMDRYGANKVMLVDPIFSEDQYVVEIEQEIRSLDPNFLKKQTDDEIVYDLMYQNVSREVVLKPLFLNADTIKELPPVNIYEMGDASVEGTLNEEYLLTLYNHMQNKGIIIDLHRHADSSAYRQFVQHNPNTELTAFSYPISEEHLYNGHSGAEPGYRIMIHPKA